MSLQHTHKTTPFIQHAHEIVLLCDGVNSPANIGSLFRLCDAFGVSEIIFFNAEIDLTSTRLRRTARSTETRIPHSTTEDMLKTLQSLKTDNYQIIGLEITSNSQSLGNLKISEQQKIALVIGNEQAGISEEIIAATDHCVHIDMFGENSSMNVAQATGITLYELTKKSL